MAPFVHLHNHTDYSLLKGASSIDRLVKRAVELEMAALAITDDGNLFGALEFYKACRDAGIQPIIGCDLFVAPDSRHSRTSLDGPNRNGRLVVLARNAEGYRNLIELSSIGYVEGFYYRPRVDIEALRAHSSGLIALTGGLSGEVPRLLLANRRDEAVERIGSYLDLFGAENVYLELTDHGIPEQKTLIPMLAEISRDLGVPMVAANDTHYVVPDDAVAHDVLLCIGSNRKRSETNRFRFSTNEFYLKSADEMERVFSAYPEAIASTLAVAQRCDFEIELPGPRFPQYQIPADFDSRDAYLRHLTHEGLHERYGNVTDEITARADYELDVIISMGFTGYFLIVWDFIKYARDNDIPVGPGRGSGAGSLVAYALRITDIDPLHYGLLFERFLNPDRVSMPDFDIDFCFERRGEVIDYVTARYGRDKVGQIITFGTLKTKLVIRDVARVLGLEFDEADEIAKLVPRDLSITLEKALAQEPKLREIEERGGAYAELIDVSRRLEGLHRHASTHAAGIVIGDRELTHYVPLYRDPRTGSISTQFTMNQLEDAGLVKMDFLGLKTLTLIKNTEALVRMREPDFAVATIPERDAATFRMLGEGQSAMVFQFESTGMQDILKRAKPNRIEDLIALNALYRPGPMQFIDQFVDSKNGKTPITYPLPALEPILRETYGVIVYQEQVMQIVQVVAGFSLGQADILRRAMGKKKPEAMAQMKADFVAGAIAKGYTEKQAIDMFVLLEPFAGYGFNKSHAAAYAILAYQTAFLKANYPVEFLAANLTNEINNPDKFAEYLSEAESMGVTVRPPSINESGARFVAADGEIIYGLVGIKNVGSGAVESILAERDRGGAFESAQDFLERIDPRAVNRKVFETLVLVGAFDRLGATRATLHGNLDTLWESAAHARENRASGQGGLFDDVEPQTLAVPLQTMEEWDAATRLGHERELLGAYFSGHPLDDYRAAWRAGTTIHLGRLESATPGDEGSIIALVRSLRTVQTKKGDRMAVAVVEDFNGSSELVAFPETWATCEHLLRVNEVVGLLVQVDRRRDQTQLVLKEVRSPEEMDEHDVGSVHIRLADDAVSEEALFRLRGDLGAVAGGADLFIHLGNGSEGTVVRAGSQLRVSSRREAIDRMREHPLVEEVWNE